MMKNLSLRIRLTIMIVILLSISSIVLSLVLNYSATKMTDTIELTPIITDASIIAQTKLVPATTEKSFLLNIIQQSKITFRLDSITYTVIIIMLGGVLTYYIVGQALKPVVDLNTQIQNIDINNLAETVDYQNTNDELAAFAKSFNNMTNKLTASFEMQKQFSANVAHELRTPLAVLQTKIDVFKKSNHHIESDYDSLVTLFEKYTVRMTDIVNSLLELTNSQVIDFNESIDIYSLSEEILLEFTHIAAENHITLKLEGNETIILGDYNLIHRALYNLIENAIKYNRQNGSVVVKIRTVTDSTIIEIVDTGIGITTENHSNIFKVFFRVEESRSRETAGSGLGLSIVKNIVDRHNGLIKVSNNISGGCTFRMVLKNKPI